MRGLSSLAWRNFRRNFGRLSLTATGIALGVAILFGVLVANASSTASLNRQLGRVDKPAVRVHAFGADGGTVPGAAVETAAGLTGVAAAWANVGFMTDVVGHTEDDGEPKRLWMYGGVQLKEGPEEEPAPGALVWKQEGVDPAAGRDEVGLTRTMAADLDVEIGENIELRTPAGTRSFEVTALDYVESGETPDGAARTSLATARDAFGGGEVFQEAYLELASGTDVATWVEAHAADVPATVRLVPAEAGVRPLRDLVAVTHAAFTTVAAITLFVAAFLIYLTLSMAVIERSRIYGTLRAVGARRRQVMRLVLGEAFVLGVGATAAGLVFGFVAAAVLVRLTASLYGADDMAMVVPAGALVAAVGLGMVATMGAAFVPARRAARVSPVASMRGTAFEDNRLSRGWIVGLLAIAIGVALPFVPGQRGLDAGTIFLLVGAVLLVPLVMRPIAGVAGAVTRRLAPGVGDVGVMHLVKQRSRSAYTLALVMVVLAAVFAIGSANLSIQGTLDRDLEQRFASDLVLWGNPTLPPGAADDVRGPIVDRTTPIWFGHTTAATGTNVELVMIDPATYFDVQSFAWVHGDDESAQRALSSGGAIVASEALLYEMGVGVGDDIAMRTSGGDATFTVAASYASIELEDRATIGIGDGRRLFGAQEPNGLFVVLGDGTALDDGRTALQAVFADRSGVFVEPVADERRELTTLVNRYFGVFFAIVLVAAVVGLLGLANTLAMSIVQRTREIGVLRAVGTHRRQVAAMVVVESATLTLVALVLAVPLGLLLSVTLLRTTASSIGMVVHYTFPWLMVPIVGAIAITVALAAAVAPGRRAARVDPVVALRFE
jgi:putative ABC transport system permease protein